VILDVILLDKSGRCAMETNNIYLHKLDSSSSAIDLTKTGLSAPPSPALKALDSRALLSRRRSWSHRRVAPGQDPLQDALASDTMAEAYIPPVNYLHEDAFVESPTEDRALKGFSFTADTSEVDYSKRPFESSQVASSTTSLMMAGESQDEHREDDEAHLTKNMSLNGTESVWADADPERLAGSSRRRTVTYSTLPSSLKKTNSVFRDATRNIRRVSLRVVNMAGNRLENQVRLVDDNGTPTKSENEDEQFPDFSKVNSIRGRTLGFLGPDSKLRLSFYRMLIYPCVLVLGLQRCPDDILDGLNH